MQAKTITAPSFSGIDPYNALMHPGGRPTERKRPELGERIAQARERAGMSQYELAEKLGVSQPTVVAWERKAINIRSDTLAKLTAVLKVSADELLGLKPIRERGPAGRNKQVFDELTQLPRRQQERILATVEDMLVAQKTKKAS